MNNRSKFLVHQGEHARPAQRQEGVLESADAAPHEKTEEDSWKVVAGAIVLAEHDEHLPRERVTFQGGKKSLVGTNVGSPTVEEEKEQVQVA